MKIKANSYFRKIFLISAVMLTVCPSTLISQNVKNASGKTIFPGVMIPNTEMRDFHSKILDRDMEIYIKLPSAYSSNPDKKYPVWYFTDANRSFPIIANITSIFDLPVPSMQEVIVVGIGYRIRDMYEWALFRTCDLTPVNLPSVDEYWNKLLKQISQREFSVKTGGSDRFIDFIEKELFPFIEENYRVTATDRCLGGYSYGGLFSLYVLFTRPDLFTRYFAGSPSISFGNGLLFDLEKKFASSHNDINAKICITAGGAEDSTTVADVNRMTEKLRSENYKGLSVETYIFPMETHQSCMAGAFMRGYVVLDGK